MYFIFSFFLCDYLLSLFRFCPGVFSLEVLFLLELGSCEVFIFPCSPVCLLDNGLFSRTGLAMELFAFKLSLSHLERRSVNETQEVKYLFIYLFFHLLQSHCTKLQTDNKFSKINRFSKYSLHAVNIPITAFKNLRSLGSLTVKKLPARLQAKFAQLTDLSFHIFFS